MSAPAGLLQQGIQAARRGQKTQAREILLRVVEAEPENETAWIWLTGVVDSVEDKLIACENALTLNPSNEKVRAYLYQLLRQQGRERPPLSRDENAKETLAPGTWGQAPRPSPAKIDLRALARRSEAEGRLDDALAALAEFAAVTTDSYQFNQIYREITRLEALQKEKILHIAPASTILRLALSWPLLYLSLALVQAGLNPFAPAAWYLWVGLPVVIGGALLLALAEVRAPHPVWRTIFREENAAGSDPARVAAAAAGWVLVGLPHILLLIDSLNRLGAFQIPYPPLAGGG